MATPAPNVYNQVSRDAQTSLTEFSMAFEMAYAGVGEPWATETKGILVQSSQFLTTTYPIPLSAPEFREFSGDMRFRRLGEKSLSVRPRTWQDGVMELEARITAPDFIGWNSEPEAMAAESKVTPNRVVAELLRDGKTIVSWENADGVTTVKFFDAAHPNNPLEPGKFGTYKNLHTNKALTAKSILEMKLEMRKLKRPNGKTPRGVRMTHILVPPDLEDTARQLRNNDNIPLAQTGAIIPGLGSEADKSGNVLVQNPVKGAFDYVVGDELEEEGVWYPMCLGRPGTFPWLVHKRLRARGGEMETIIHDYNSELYKAKLMLGVSKIMEMNAALVHPWVLHRCEPPT